MKSDMEEHLIEVLYTFENKAHHKNTVVHSARIGVFDIHIEPTKYYIYIYLKTVFRYRGQTFGYWF